MDTINDEAKKYLGQSGSYAVYTDRFDETLLVRMTREKARKDWDITGKEFVGCDVWHCHESTFLTANGLPVAGTLKFSYSSSSTYMVESKSMKLYLNSFDMWKSYYPSIDGAIEQYEFLVRNHLTHLLETEVTVKFHKQGEKSVNPVEGYQDLYEILTEVEKLKVDDYNTGKNHLVFVKEEGMTQDVKVFTNVLRSRCRHTKQKDTGTAFFHIVTTSGIVDLETLLLQVISLREQNEFHEFCAEKLYCDITRLPGIVDCTVMLLYARRGSLDINPVRSSSWSSIPKELSDVNFLTTKTQGQ